MNKVVLIVVGVVVVVGAGAAVMITTKKDKTVTNTVATTPSVEQTPSPTTPTSASSKATASAVTIQDFAFGPSTLTVKKGTTVTWTNKDSAPHTVTSTGTGSLASKTLQKGDSYSFTFDSAGTYGYHCTFHPNMTATVTVTE